MIKLPKVIAGTSGLGNLYVATSLEQKKDVVAAYLNAIAPELPVFDSAGKYGAGLALETLGKCLQELGVPPGEVMISNKLGWYQKPLQTAEPLFEPGVWKSLRNDAEQHISYNGILRCFEQGNKLLAPYSATMVLVHDADEYLAAAGNHNEEQQRYEDVLGAYRALHELKQTGVIRYIGVGAKNWKIIQRISNDIELDWVMLANSCTIYSHPAELLNFIQTLAAKKITVINSAVFHGGFLIGSDYFNYKPVSRQESIHHQLYAWRDMFYSICNDFSVEPSVACIQFALQVPGVTSIALNSTSPDRTAKNVHIAQTKLPPAFWARMREEHLLQAEWL